MTAQYLFFFAQTHHEFRMPELLSLSKMFGFDLGNPEDQDPTRPFLIADLQCEEHARLLASRSILIKSVYEYYGHGSSYDDLHLCNRRNRDKWAKYIPDTSFKFLVTAYNHKIPQSRQKEIVESFAYMGFLGKIDMKNPDIELACFEEYIDKRGTTRDKHEGDGSFRHVYFGRLVATGSARSLITKFDVKKRSYYGNTSMEAEISLLMANQTLASSGKLIYDPFMGTGSMAYPTAYFGAQIFGSDIDGRQMRGKGDTPGIIRAATQYGVATRIIDLCTFDITQNPWRCGDLFDAIITDPPYGVRAGAKRLGRKRELSPARMTAYLEHRASPRPDDQPYIPPTRPYELSRLAVDLVLLSRYLLKPGGRLVFFLPTVTDEYEEVDIYSMLCPGMEVIANSLQDFGSWGRRLVTIQKTTSDTYLPPVLETQDSPERQHVPAHKDFREKYFRGFKPES
ncbi:tRNA guanosine-2'-O-methyltransferase [Armillaria novae-zelandiae]|uniref:tRNA (guanine(10)-N(2))-methyltransferase n=1 Tax=Armillaria novae-zelandiae TaxID=153914 RepID=A0AA39UG14_9AGAR|nr:tRNA guanosine-2'-O-methyltransferase [Armillaria novae-zelandiae]